MSEKKNMILMDLTKLSAWGRRRYQYGFMPHGCSLYSTVGSFWATESQAQRLVGQGAHSLREARSIAMEELGVSSLRMRKPKSKEAKR